MSENQDLEIKEIMEGFNLFDPEKGGLINPIEIKEIMDIMNMNKKNHFLYNIITNLCANEEIQQKGGINAEDFISLLDQELEDSSSVEGLQKIFSIFSDFDSNKISLPIFSQILNQYNDLNLGKDEEKIKKLISKPEIIGKEIDFNEFQDIMNSEKEKTNLVYRKKPSINSKNKNGILNDKNIINNNIDINNNKDNIKGSKSINENNLDFNNPNFNYNSTNQMENEFNYNEEIIQQDEINNKNIIDLNYDNDINNFDNVNPKFETSNTKEEKRQSKKKYRHMHETPKNKIEIENQNDEKELNNQKEKIKNNKFNEKMKNNIEENINNKEDKTEKRYHRRYRNIKSPPQIQKEEKSQNGKI